MKGVIIDYKMGNTASVEKAFKKVGENIKLSNQKDDIKEADYLVLPGVGAFGDGMKNLHDLGLIDLLNQCVLEEGKPFLGICIGMQLLAEKGYEFGENQGLGWIKGEVRKLNVPEEMRLPHVGWNNVTAVNDHPLFQDIPDDNFYFVHTFHLIPSDPSILAGTCDYGEMFAAAIQQDNIWATQFHPEKSQDSGLQVIKNFLLHSRHA